MVAAPSGALAPYLMSWSHVSAGGDTASIAQRRGSDPSTLLILAG